jgi:hypothetical protein
MTQAINSKPVNKLKPVMRVKAKKYQVKIKVKLENEKITQNL